MAELSTPIHPAAAISPGIYKAIDVNNCGVLRACINLGNLFRSWNKLRLVAFTLHIEKPLAPAI
jgi:hypothetical protein